MTAPSAAEKVEVFDLTSPYLAQGRSNKTLVRTDLFSLRVKVYAQGGENALHNHTEEEHAFIVLEGRATFYDADGNATVVEANEGIFLPRGASYRFESGGDRNLVLLRAGAWRNVDDNVRVAPDGRPLPASAKENKGSEPVPVPGRSFSLARD